MLLKKWNLLFNNIILYFDNKNSNDKIILPFFRISIAFIALIDVLSLRNDLLNFYSKNNTIIPQELLFLRTDYFEYLYPLYSYILQFQLEYIFYYGTITLYLILIFCLLIGFLSRYVALLALFLQLIIFKSFSQCNYGYDNFFTMSLFYCFIFPVGKYYSINNILNNNKINLSIINYPRVLQIHLCIVYFVSGLSKSLDINWWTGNSLWYSICASPYHFVYSIPNIFYLLVGVGVVLLELLYPIFVFIKKTRKIVVYLCILMHLFIGVMLELYSFAFIMIVWNLSAFLLNENN